MQMARDPDILRRQCADIEAYLRGAWREEDLARCEPHGSLVTTPRRGQTRATSANYTDAVHAKVDRFPLHVRLYALDTLRALPWTLRAPVHLVVILGCPHKATAAALGCSPRTLHTRLRQALETIARSLWSDDGQQRLPTRSGV
jgi:DNA-directed RNA polymerase specialized sigma24 family protein